MTKTKIPITAFVMTLNEERNLAACLDSICERVDQIVLVDSFSTDRTIEIARRYTDFVYENRFVNYSKQYLWGMEHCDIRNDWVLRIDADERWTSEGLDELERHVGGDLCDGLTVRMKIYFMDRWLRFGGMYPNLFLRAYKRSKGGMEDRWMDEHIHVEGRVAHPRIDVIEANYDRQRNLVLWTTKHNGYSTREAVENLIARHRLRTLETIADPLGGKTARKRWVKENVYSRVPLFVRPFLYFFFRYFLQLGFLDGKQGFVFHVLHAFWYRFLVDAKIYQIEHNSRVAGETIRDTVARHWQIEI